MEYFEKYCSLLHNALLGIDKNKLKTLKTMLCEAAEQSRHVFILGNGGSCASASHWVCDMGKGINVDGKPRMRIMALADNTAILTAVGNDISYADVFAYQLRNFADKDDLVIILSASGNSPNLIRALEYTKSIGCHNISIVGDFNGAVIPLSELAIVIPSQNYGIIEDTHTIINHALSQYILQLNRE